MPRRSSAALLIIARQKLHEDGRAAYEQLRHTKAAAKAFDAFLSNPWTQRHFIGLEELPERTEAIVTSPPYPTKERPAKSRGKPWAPRGLLPHRIRLVLTEAGDWMAFPVLCLRLADEWKVSEGHALFRTLTDDASKRLWDMRKKGEVERRSVNAVPQWRLLVAADPATVVFDPMCGSGGTAGDAAVTADDLPLDAAPPPPRASAAAPTEQPSAS